MRTRGEVEGLLMEHLEMLFLIALKFSKEPRQAVELVTRTFFAAIQAPELRSLRTLFKPWVVTKLREIHINRNMSGRA